MQGRSNWNSRKFVSKFPTMLLVARLLLKFQLVVSWLHGNCTMFTSRVSSQITRAHIMIRMYGIHVSICLHSMLIVKINYPQILDKLKILGGENMICLLRCAYQKWKKHTSTWLSSARIFHFVNLPFKTKFLWVWAKRVYAMHQLQFNRVIRNNFRWNKYTATKATIAAIRNENENENN